MVKNIQQSLNIQLNQCQFKSGQITPCRYHINRVNCSIFRIDVDVLEESSHTAILHPHKTMKKLAFLFREKRDPAGGWYLVKEQREWLEENLFNILKYVNKGQSIRILEAGVASFVHHYTYLAILVNVLHKLKNDIRIALTVVDKCPYPIMQINAVENELAKGLKHPTRIDLYNIRFKIDKDFISIMNSERRSFGQISTELRVIDLKDIDAVIQLGSYDIITEHFLTSVLDKQIPEITQIRRNYSKILKQGGALLTAVGITKGHKNYNKYQEIHQRFKFKIIDGKSKNVWDPYGLKREVIESFIDREKSQAVGVSLDNILSIYIKE